MSAVVYNIDAISTNDAIEKAQQSMRNISRQETEFAESHLGIYVCVYDHGKIDVINNEEDWRHLSHYHKMPSAVDGYLMLRKNGVREYTDWSVLS
jgi:hypothetical protein